MNRFFRKNGSPAQDPNQGQSRWRRLFGNFRRTENSGTNLQAEDFEEYLTCPNCNHTQVSRQSYVCPRCHRDIRYG